ncbi:hypothetical protein HDV01_001049 [Terramyces sp. JEL0728]|nr:hypothetical protein HDV01_001049 [Terramyces sp. JEL0728]
MSRRFTSPYKILGLTNTATQKEIKQAYYKLVQELHPDKTIDLSLKKINQRKFVQINNAYNLLKTGKYKESIPTHKTCTYRKKYNDPDINYESMATRDRKTIHKSIAHGIIIGLLSFGLYAYAFVNYQRVKKYAPNHPLIKLMSGKKQ